MSFGFPGLVDMNRRTVRAETNPLDVSTIVSILPKEIDEKKCTIQPGRFIIPPGTFDKPALLTIGPSSWWKEISDEEPLLEIPISSIVVANSVVQDYCNGIYSCNMGDSMPGLFFLPGRWNRNELMKEKKSMLDMALIKQLNWYKSLVKIADTLWARTNGNPLSISDDMRLAAKELNLDGGKEWTKDSQTMELVRCKACGSLKNPAFPICSSCKAIDDPEKAAKLGLVFAK